MSETELERSPSKKKGTEDRKKPTRLKTQNQPENPEKHSAPRKARSVKPGSDHKVNRDSVHHDGEKKTKVPRGESKKDGTPRTDATPRADSNLKKVQKDAAPTPKSSARGEEAKADVTEKKPLEESEKENHEADEDIDRVVVVPASQVLKEKELLLHEKKRKREKLQTALAKKEDQIKRSIPKKHKDELIEEEKKAQPQLEGNKRTPSTQYLVRKSSVVARTEAAMNPGDFTREAASSASKRILTKKKTSSYANASSGPPDQTTFLPVHTLPSKPMDGIIVPVFDKIGITNREKVAVEFLTTEVSYVQGLEILVEKYIKPLREKSKDKEKDKGWGELFLNIEGILVVNQKFCQRLEERLNHWEEEGQDHLGDLISKMVPELHEPYAQFSAGYGKALQTIEKKSESNPQLRKALEAIDEEVKSTYNLKYKDFFVTPIQRIPRYVLLIRDLHKQTPQDSRDFVDLENAGTQMSQLASDVNEYVRAQESAERMKILLNRGGGLERLTTEPPPYGKRFWLKEGEVLAFASLDAEAIYTQTGKLKIEKKKNVNIILFTDILVCEAFVSKKAIAQDYHIPTKIMWSLQKNEAPEALAETLTDADFNFSILLQSPEKYWAIGFKSNADKISWLKEIDGFISSTIPGYRKGQFLFKDLSSYSGEWKNGWMDGYGVYQSTKETLDGNWEHTTRVGFGTIKSGGISRIGGWRFKNAEISTADDEGMWASDALTETDWNTLLSNCITDKKPAGTVLIHQGKPNGSLIRCKSGQFSVQKTNSDGTKTVLATLGAGAVVGDTSVLVSNIATANVVCETICEIEMLSVSLLYSQFHHNPALCMRFYRHMARKMAGILKGLHAPKARTPAAPRSNFKAAQVTSSNSDRKLVTAPQLKFHLPVNEVLFLETPCQKQVFPRNKKGIFFLFASHICFESHAFGQNEFESKALVKITDISYKKDVLTFSTKNQKLIFTGIKVDQGMIMSVWNEAVAKGKAAPEKSKLALKQVEVTSIDKRVIEMSPDEWNLVLALNVEKKYVRGEFILKEGEERPITILQLDSGRVKITKNNEDGTQKVIGIQERGSDSPPLFGEMSFVESSSLRAVSSANIIADSDDVTFSILEGVKIFLLFVAYPNLAGKFYCFLANFLAKRVAEREAAILAEAKKDSI